MVIIGSLFFIFGFITWLNGALIPFLQIICDLNEIEALFVAFCFYISYVVMALPMSRILDKTGFHQGMVIGLVIVGIGLILFVPAAMSEMFSVFLFAQFILGTGLTILQTASNPYVVRVGPESSAAARIAFMGILNKAAGVLAPALFTVLVLAEFADVSKSSVDALSLTERAETVSQMADRIIMPYVGMAIAIWALAFCLAKVSLPAIDAPEDTDSSATSVLQFPQLVLGVVALFFYVGVEVIAGDTIGLYGSSLGLSGASSLTSYTMAAMVVGYVVGLFLIPKYFSQVQALSGSAALGLVLTTALLFSSDTSTAIAGFLWGWAGVPVIPDSVALIAMLGLSNALCWPTIWPLALAEVGKFTAKASALLIMGLVGGALLPLAYGLLAEATTAKSAYSCLLVGYAYIGWYALIGCKKREW
ncbi:glucose/galactose MFS transporter (plasmid) [Alteromonas sp. I4]|nr:glucose/galactose MFS transporter [Alteromonas sp. I4]